MNADYFKLKITEDESYYLNETLRRSKCFLKEIRSIFNISNDNYYDDLYLENEYYYIEGVLVNLEYEPKVTGLLVSDSNRSNLKISTIEALKYNLPKNFNEKLNISQYKNLEINDFYNNIYNKKISYYNFLDNKANKIKDGQTFIFTKNLFIETRTNKRYLIFNMESNQESKNVLIKINNKIGGIKMANNNNLFKNSLGGMDLEIEEGSLALTMDGKIAYRKENGDYISYDEVNNEFKNQMNLVIEDANQFLMLLPVQKIENGDIIKKDGKYYYILSEKEMIDFDSKLKIDVIPEKNIMGVDLYVKVVNMMNMMNTNDNQFNPMLLMMLNNNEESSSSSSDMMKMMMMSNMFNGQTQNNNNMFMGMNTMNPMMLMMLMKDGGSMKEMMMMQYLSGMINNSNMKVINND